MEHCTVTKIDDKFYKVVPDEGYTLYNKVDKQYYSEAVTKTPKKFIAIAK